MGLTFDWTARLEFQEIRGAFRVETIRSVSLDLVMTSTSSGLYLRGLSSALHRRPERATTDYTLSSTVHACSMSSSCTILGLQRTSVFARSAH